MSKLVFLDHVAIRVSDIEQSARWYEKVLGLRRYQPGEWKPFPIMVQAGNSGLALFPDSDPPTSESTKNAFHIAFRVESGSLDVMYKMLVAQGIDVTFKDHVHFHSIYFSDPDGYRLEITEDVRHP